MCKSFSAAGEFSTKSLIERPLRGEGKRGGGPEGKGG